MSLIRQAGKAAATAGCRMNMKRSLPLVCSQQHQPHQHQHQPPQPHTPLSARQSMVWMSTAAVGGSGGGSSKHPLRSSSNLAPMPETDDVDGSYMEASGGISSALDFRYAEQVVVPIATFRMMEQDGSLRHGAEQHMPQLDPEQWRELYQYMVRVKEMDKVFMSSQRQGRISFYMTS